MAITFKKLTPPDFSLMLCWLNSPHIKAWWEPYIIWTEALITDKYLSYTQGYKSLDNGKKPIHAYIFYKDDKPIGYLQWYNAYDFPRKRELSNLPSSLVACDMFIGDTNFLYKGIGPRVLQQALYIFCSENFSHAFVDPDAHNNAAIKAYEKAGFSITKQFEQEIWMIKEL